MSQNILEVKNLTHEYSLKGSGFLGLKKSYFRALDNINFYIRAGETLALVGESGCGKSTLGRCIVRLLKPTRGEIFYEGADISQLSSSELKPYRREIQYIFQDPYSSLNPRHSIYEILAEPLEIHRLAKSGSDRKNQVARLMEQVGLSPDAMNRFPHEFSGGQRQRLSIARALAVKPKLLICDEPVSALDVSIQAQVLQLLKDLQAQLGLTYLFISHDLNVVRYLSDRVVVMYKGEIVETAERDKLFETPQHSYTKALLSAIPTLPSSNCF